MTLQWRRSDPSLEEAQQKLREAQQRKPEAGQRNPERYQRKTLPRIGPFQWVTTIRRKNPLSPGAAPRGGSFGDRTTLSVVSDNRKKKSRSYRVGCCGEGIGSMAEVADGAIKASWPGLSARPPPSAFLPVAPRRDSFLRRPGVDGRDKPGHDGKGSTNDSNRSTNNCHKSQNSRSYRLAVVGKESGHGGGGGRRHQGVMAGLVPAIRSRAYAGKREKPCDRPPSCRSRRGGTRSCGGPAWMAGTSPAMTARVRRTNSKPVDQQITP